MVQKIVAFDVALKSTERQWVQKVPEVYTNDLGSVTIQFKITDCTDVELTNSTAIVLLKMRDGSFFQGPSVDVTRTLNVFSYNLKENEGNHDGLAEIQLVVTIAGKEFGSQKYNFKVISGLDSEIAREIMIYDWSTLTAEARAYIDQFTADEVLRDAEFDNAQFDRNAAFNSAQTQRVITFNSSEAARVTLFNSKETARAAGYDADHERASTDHTGATTDRTNAATDRTNAATDRTNADADRTLAGTDHTRAESDHTRAESDHTRADADSATVAGFNGRLTDVETDTSLDATNMVTNGDFANPATTGWVPKIATLSVSEGAMSITGTGEWSDPQARWTMDITIGQKLYVRFKYLVTSASVRNVKTRISIDGNQVVIGPSISKPEPNIWSTYSAVLQPTPSSFAKNMYTGVDILHDYLNNADASGSIMKLDNISILDLTATFGAGKEPTVEQMDAIMAKFENSWFDGVKPIQTIETLYQEKANKVQEAWITPTLVNGATTYDANTVGYIKDEMGFVHLKGRIVTPADNTQAFKLPEGYRPIQYLNFPCFDVALTYNAIEIGMWFNPYVLVSKKSTAYISLDGITFRAEA